MASRRQNLLRSLDMKGKASAIGIRESKLADMAEAKNLGINVNKYGRLTTRAQILQDVANAREQMLRDQQRRFVEEQRRLEAERVAERARLESERAEIRRQAIRELEEAKAKAVKNKEISRNAIPLSRVERGLMKKVDVMKKADLLPVQEKLQMVLGEKETILEQQKKIIERMNKGEAVKEGEFSFTDQLEMNRINLNQVMHEEETYKSRVSEIESRINELKEASKAVSKFMGKELSTADAKEIEKLKGKLEAFMPSAKKAEIEARKKEREEAGQAKGFEKVLGLGSMPISQEIKTHINRVEALRDRMKIVGEELRKAEALGEPTAKYTVRMGQIEDEIREENKAMSKISKSDLGKAIAETRKDSNGLKQALADQMRAMKGPQTKLQKEISRVNGEIASIREELNGPLAEMPDMKNSMERQLKANIERMNMLQKQRRMELERGA